LTLKYAKHLDGTGAGTGIGHESRAATWQAAGVYTWPAGLAKLFALTVLTASSVCVL